MSLHRTAARRDANEPSIIAALEAVGADVRPVSSKMLPDLIVGFRGVTYLLGCKIPDGPRGGDRARRKDRPSGDERPANWNGGPWVIVTTPAEALAAIGALQRGCGSCRHVDAHEACVVTEDDRGCPTGGRECAYWQGDANTAQPTPGPALERKTAGRRLLKPAVHTHRPPPEWLEPTAHPAAEITEPDAKERT